MNTASDLVTRVTELVSFPDVAVQVNDMLSDGLSDAEHIGAVIEQDPALTATLLKLANSPVYRGAADIETVSDAFTRMGAREIQQLTLGICAGRAFSGIPNEIISVKDFWTHSLLCGAAAKSLTRIVKVQNAGMVFTAGMLHDIGHLVMFHLVPEESMQALALCRDEFDAENLYLAEREILGFDHADVGRALGELWNWPTTLVNCIARHHDPFRYPDCSDSEVVIHLADGLATAAELGSTDIADISLVDERTWDRLGLKQEAAEELLPEITDSVSSLLKVFVH